jgi:hypothetical protein
MQFIGEPRHNIKVSKQLYLKGVSKLRKDTNGQYKNESVTRFANYLICQTFTDEQLAHSNVEGTDGRTVLKADPRFIAVISEVSQTCKINICLDTENTEFKFMREKINDLCRMKRYKYNHRV